MATLLEGKEIMEDNQLPEVPDKVMEALENSSGGKIQILASDIVPEGTFLATKELSDAFKNVKTKAKELGTEEQPKKVEPLANGFMFQAGKTQAGDEPFYLEVHLVGEDQYAVSGNKNGMLTRDDIKALRKSLKSVMNQEKEQYLPKEEEKPAAKTHPGAAANWDPNDAYPDLDEDEEMDFDDYNGDAPNPTQYMIAEDVLIPGTDVTLKKGTLIPSAAQEDDIPFEPVDSATFDKSEWSVDYTKHGTDPNLGPIPIGSVIESTATGAVYQITDIKKYNSPLADMTYDCYWVNPLTPGFHLKPFHLSKNASVKVLKKTK